MPGKRKANDMSPGEPQEKLTKKAKLKLARERAAQFAQRDKERIESRKSPKPTAPPKVKPKVAKNIVEKKPVATKPVKVATKSVHKLTLAERRKIASENAKEFAARDRAGLEFKKKVASPSPMEGVEHTQVPSSAVYPPLIPGIVPNQQTFGAAIDPNQVAEYERMRQMQYLVMQQQMATQQQQELMQQHAAAAKQKLSPAAAQRQVSGISRKNAAIASESVDDNNFVGEMNEEDLPPPPPALMAQVSQQVLFNAKNEDADDANPVSTEDEGQYGGKEDQTIADDNSKVKTRWISKMTAVFIVGAAVVSIILMVPTPSFTENMPSLPDDTMIPKEPLCFLSSDSEFEGEYEEACSNGSGGIQCPTGGVCEGGKLVACENDYQAVSDRGGKCVLDDSFIAMKTALINQLVSHASQICEQSSKPSFKYTMLQKELQPTNVEDEIILADESEDLVKALIDEGFVVYERDGLYVGLPEDFEVNLPIYCFLGNVGQWLLQELGLLLLGILRFASSNLLGFVSSYPTPSGVILFLLLVVTKFRQRRAAKKKRHEDIIRTRNIAYKTLEESCGVEHCVSHIRDEIAMAMYPDSKKLKRELQKYVWPKIVDDVKRDTRVRKFQQFNKDGKTRDMWQWTAASKTPIKA